MLQTSDKLIPRTDLFGHAMRSRPRISPDGNRIAFVALYEGVDNLWLASTDDPDAAEPITKETEHGIGDFHWAKTGRHVIVAQDNAGDESWHFKSLDLETGEQVILSPPGRVEARIVALSSAYPTELVLEANDQSPEYFSLYRVNIVTGASTLLDRNDGFTWIYVDQYLKPRLAEQRADDGGLVYCTADDTGAWKPLIHVLPEDEALTRPFRIWETQCTFGPQAAEIYAMDSRGRDKAALMAWDLVSGEARLLAEDQQSDVMGILIDPVSRHPLYCASYYQRLCIQPLEPAAGTDLEYIRSIKDADWSVADQSEDGQHWIVTEMAADTPANYYHFDRRNRSLRLLFSENSDLGDHPLYKCRPEIIQARDGLELVSYLTLPGAVGEDAKGRLPLIVLPHGGPWIRDIYEFNSWAQFLADRGYATLCPNFRGSKGFGKSFLNAGDRQWGLAIYDDVEDAVHWAVNTGIADPERIAIMGASFGGYTTLMGLARSPDLYACGIDLFGPANMLTFLETIPPYWKAHHQMWKQRVGDVESEEGRAQLKSVSPSNLVHQIRAPILIGQGANDIRVVQAESDQIAAHLAERDVEVTYALYPDEGHGFIRLPNKLSFFSLVEVFLAKHLGGRFEPFGQSMVDSSLQVPVGVEHITGLKDLMADQAGSPKRHVV